MSNVPTLFKNRKKTPKSKIQKAVEEHSENIIRREGHLTDPNPYIMGSSSSHMGVDTLHMTLRGRIKNSSLFTRLQESKELLQETENEKDCLFLFKDGVNEFSWRLSRTGVKFYPYVLTGGDVVLMLSTRNHDSSLPNIKVEFGSVSCQRGIWQEYQLLAVWLSFYGIEIHESMVGRIDLAVDIFNMDFEESSQQITDKTKRICRSTKVSYHEESYSLTGLSIGKGDLQLRVYNKSKELLKPENGHKLEYFYDLWKLPVGTPVTRFEFQLRGNVLLEIFKYKNLKYVLEHIPNVWNYLTHDWCRLTAHPVDRKNKNHQRSKVSFIWSMVQHAGTTYLHTPVKRIRTNKPLVNVTQLVKQLSGLAMTIAAASGETKFTLERMYQVCQNALHEGMSYQSSDLYEMYKKYREKQSKFFSPLYPYEKPLWGCVNLQEIPF